MANRKRTKYTDERNDPVNKEGLTRQRKGEATAQHDIELRVFPGPINVIEPSGRPELTASNDMDEL